MTDSFCSSMALPSTESSGAVTQGLEVTTFGMSLSSDGSATSSSISDSFKVSSIELVASDFGEPASRTPSSSRCFASRDHSGKYFNAVGECRYARNEAERIRRAMLQCAISPVYGQAIERLGGGKSD